MRRSNVKNEIVYRLRNAGCRIDSKNRTIYKSELGSRRMKDILKEEYGFVETEELFESRSYSRLYIAHESEKDVENEYRGYGYTVIKHTEDKIAAIKSVIKSDVVFFGAGWSEIWLMTLARELGKKLIIENEQQI